VAEQHSSPYVDQGTSSAASSRSVLSPQEFASPFLSAVPALVPSHRSSSGASGRASSSSASTTSSPSTSPSPWAASQTAVLGSSPPALALPPQAYPIAQASPLVEPVKIPPMLIRAPASLDGHASRGDETLKYVRRPGATSHLTSPLALFPIAGPTRKSFSGNHSNAGNSPRLSPMLSPLIAPTKLPKQGSLGKVRCDRPGCPLRTQPARHQERPDGPSPAPARRRRHRFDGWPVPKPVGGRGRPSAARPPHALSFGHCPLARPPAR
jgi:hypothetical protein